MVRHQISRKSQMVVMISNLTHVISNSKLRRQVHDRERVGKTYDEAPIYTKSET